MSESEFGDDDGFGFVVDESFPAFIESTELVEHVSGSVLSIRVGSWDRS